MYRFLILSLLVMVHGEQYFIYKGEGNFGDQVQSLFNAISLAKGLRRTLVIPQFLEVKLDSLLLHPFENFFNLKYLQNYYKHIITMEEFSKKFTNISIVGFYRDTFLTMDFWKLNGISFDSFEYQAVQYWDVEFSKFAQEQFRIRYQGKNIMAFTDVPLMEKKFTPRVERTHIYLEWSYAVSEEVRKYESTENLEKGKFISVIILKQKDGYCNDSKYLSDLGPLTQCDDKHVTTSMCNPPSDVMAKSVAYSMNYFQIFSVFIATDYEESTRNFIRLLKDELNNDGLPVAVRATYDDMTSWTINLAILDDGFSFFGNCMDAYASFARRSMFFKKKLYHFFGM